MILFVVIVLTLYARLRLVSLCDCVAQMPLLTDLSKSSTVKLLTMKNFSLTIFSGMSVGFEVEGASASKSGLCSTAGLSSTGLLNCVI